MRKYYLLYTLAFWITALVVYASFIQTGYSLIWTSDGWQQHYKALCYYSQYLRQIARTLIQEHRLVIPNWDFSFGEGSDILNTLHYYVIGDPIALLCVFVPQRLMHYFYSFSCVLRMYLAGLAFSALAIGTGKRNRHAILTGAISYAFCMWCLFNSARHPYFLNPMIWFPLLILGVENIRRGRRPYLFILAAAISAASNFYFFYMIAILGVLYALVRLALCKELSWKQRFGLLMRMFVCAVLGVCIAGVILLPVILIFLRDPRASVPIPFQLFYPLSFYSSLPASLLGTKHPHWTTLGFSAPMVLGFAALFARKKQSRLLRVLCALCLLFLIFPIFGRLFNGMSYAINRWSWVIALLGAYILVDQWDGLLSLTRRESGKILLMILLLFGWLLLSDHSRGVLPLASCFLVLLALFAVRSEAGVGRRLTKQRVLLLLAAFSVCVIGNWFYAPGLNNYLSECVKNDEVLYQRDHTDAAAVKEIAYEAYPRFSGIRFFNNANMMAGISSTQYYWSNSSPWLNRYKTELEVNESTYSKSVNYDGRTAPLTLAGVQYYTHQIWDSVPVPYGFSQLHTVWLKQEALEEKAEKLRQSLGLDALSEELAERIMAPLADSRLDIDHTRYAMPLGCCYEKQISRETWESLDAVQRQQIQLDAVCVEDPKGSAGSALPVYDGPVADYSLPYEIEYLSSYVMPVEGGFLCTAKNAAVRLRFQGVPNAETYLRFGGLSCQITPKAALYTDDKRVDPLDYFNEVDLADSSPATRISLRKKALYQEDDYSINIPVSSSAGVKKFLELRSPDNHFSAGRNNILLNLGYQEEPVTTLTVRLPEIGRYSFDALQVFAVPMDDFGEKIDALRADSLQNVREQTNLVTGEIELERPKLLVVAIPYSTGWSATVDGAEAPVLLANGRYLGLELSAGHHEIAFRYETPFLRIGALISALSLLVFAGFVLVSERRRRRKRKS